MNHEILLLDDDNFAEEIYTSKKPVVVEFMADWCGVCKEFQTKLAELNMFYEGKVKFAQVNVDNSYRLSEGYKIEKLPTFIIYNDKEPVSYIVGTTSLRHFKETINEILE